MLGFIIYLVFACASLCFIALINCGWVTSPGLECLCTGVYYHPFLQNVHEGTTRKQTSNGMVRIREGANWWGTYSRSVTIYLSSCLLFMSRCRIGIRFISGLLNWAQVIIVNGDFCRFRHLKRILVLLTLENRHSSSWKYSCVGYGRPALVCSLQQY